MGRKYIIEIGRLERLYKAFIGAHGKPEITWLSPEVDLTPYTEPDTEAAYAHGYSNAEIKYRAEVKEAYQKGLSDAWDAARKIASDNAGQNYSIFGQHFTVEILNTHSASEAIEEIRAYEQAQKEKEEQEQSVTTEEVMRQYLDTFCKRHFCSTCPLHTSEFTCGRGYHFMTKNPISNEEVRRAYAKVLQHEEVG